jgi:RIO-like serine/threonine protein kinase
LDCVLKFFPVGFRLTYEREIAAYNRLLDYYQLSGSALSPKPLGYAEWSSSKYTKAIGHNIPSLLKGTKDKVIYVLMLEFVEGLLLGHVVPSEKAIVAVLSGLYRMHALGIVHGDVSTSNVIISEEQEDAQAIWLDFGSSWTNASPQQLKWERENALKYFADWVSITMSTVESEVLILGQSRNF